MHAYWNVVSVTSDTSCLWYQLPLISVTSGISYLWVSNWVLNSWYFMYHFIGVSSIIWYISESLSYRVAYHEMKLYMAKRYLMIFPTKLFNAMWYCYTHVGDKSMVVTLSWWQLWDVGDSFNRFCHQHPLYLTLASGTKIQKLSPISKFCH